MHGLTDRHCLLMSVDHAAKGNTRPLAPGRLRQQIIVAGEQNAAKRARAVKEVGVKRFADDKSDVAWLEDKTDVSARVLGKPK